jgi:transcriptional regulator with XRE-family HTH domain
MQVAEVGSGKKEHIDSKYPTNTAVQGNCALLYIGHFVRYISAMMTRTEFIKALNELGLTQLEAARLLSVDARTVRRWADDTSQMPGPAVQALKAWLRLHRLGLAWRPDGLPIGEDEPEELAKQIALYRQHAIDLAALLKRVEGRGGPAAPWNVDLDAHEATLGSMTVGFYTLANGGFSPSTYSRSDRDPDMELDAALIEDAYACIAEALRKKRARRPAPD